jgi:hypothetical protein
MIDNQWPSGMKLPVAKLVSDCKPLTTTRILAINTNQRSTMIPQKEARFFASALRAYDLDTLGNCQLLDRHRRTSNAVSLKQDLSLLLDG